MVAVRILKTYGFLIAFASLICLFAYLAIRANTDLLQSNQSPNSQITYFNELVFGSEYGNTGKTIKKWTSDIRIFVTGIESEALLQELSKVIDEIERTRIWISVETG